MNRQHVSQTLKSRLSNLSNAAGSTLASASSSASSTLASSSATQKKRGILPWSRRRNSVDDEEPPECDQAKLEEVMSRIICQAGVDYETRPMVVITAAALPDPREISYDLLLSCILSTLDLYVESDYTVVFLASGGKHNPGWNWIWKAYRSLSRKYRKNLKKLYIVHSNMFSKMLVSLAGAIISPKFFRKIQYVGSLSALARYVPITQIDIAPEVYRENLKYEAEISLPQAQEALVFGVPLDQLVGDRTFGGGIPTVLTDCVDYIRSTGLDVEGLFRRSPNSVLLRQAQQAYDRGHPVSLSSFNDPHIAAVLLKKFFRDLPQPVFPESLYPVIRRCPRSTDPDDMTSVTYIRKQVLGAIPQNVVDVLGYILHLLHDVSLRSSVNKMDATNLALCFSPNLVSSRNPTVDVQMCSIPSAPQMSSRATSQAAPVALGPSTVASVVKLCIERYFEIFDDNKLDLPKVPLRALSEGLPDTSPSPSVTDVFVDAEEDIDEDALVMSVEQATAGARAIDREPRNFIPSHHRTSTKESNISLGSLLSDQERNAVSGSPGRPKHDGIRESQSLFSPDQVKDGSPSRYSTASRPGSRRTSGSGVERVNVTAAGFFTPPMSPSARSDRSDRTVRKQQLSEVEEREPSSA